MSIELKVKAVSLMLEAQYIRKLENRALKHARLDVKGSDSAKRQYWSLNSHRRYHIRPEARLTNLARGYIKGLDYRQIENKVKEDKRLGIYDVQRIAKLVNRYGVFRHSEEKIEEWVKA